MANSITYQTSHPVKTAEGVGAKEEPLLAAEPVVEGFADKVPLSIAMQQVLPQGMTYMLDDGVNPGQLVSWRGGRPWQTVLREMLEPSGLKYKAGKRLVKVSNSNAAPTVISGSSQTSARSAGPLPGAPSQNPSQNYVPLAPVSQQDVMAAQVPPPYQPMGQPMYSQQVYAQPMMAPQPMMMQPYMMQGMSPQPMMMGPQPLQIQNPALFAPQAWEARPGQTLRALLQDWCMRAGTELDWQAEYDYPVTASLHMTGTFEEAVRTLLSGFNGAHPVPYGRLHYNPAAGQSILIVEASGNHYGD
ncbi:MAG: TcpQ domain-containing protein [Proteobacteria bacterium]|nr:TcpQ domain-containing protein [Pseudomonadota bacterium]